MNVKLKLAILFVIANESVVMVGLCCEKTSVSLTPQGWSQGYAR